MSRRNPVARSHRRPVPFRLNAVAPSDPRCPTCGGPMTYQRPSDPIQQVWICDTDNTEVRR